MTKYELTEQNESLKLSNRYLLQDKLQLTRELRMTRENLRQVLEEVAEYHEECAYKDSRIDDLEKTISIMSGFLSDVVLEGIAEQVESERRLKDES